MYYSSETAQVELSSGLVKAPAAKEHAWPHQPISFATTAKAHTWCSGAS